MAKKKQNPKTITLIFFDEAAEIKYTVVNGKDLALCMSPVRFLGGTCNRYYLCEHLTEVGCKATPSTIAREKVERAQDEGQTEIDGEPIAQVAICANCDQPIVPSEPGFLPFTGDRGTSYAGKPICDNCYDDDLSEPCATIYYNDSDEEPKLIGSCRNETEGDFTVEWHSTDAWRGYFELKSERFVELFTDAILSGHESEKMLKQLHDKLREKLEEHKIEYVRAFCRSSNVFMTSLEIWVEKDKLFIAQLTLAMLKREVNYDDPLYSTGILMPREAEEKLFKLFPERHMERDSDIKALVEEKGEKLLGEIMERSRK